MHYRRRIIAWSVLALPLLVTMTAWILSAATDHSFYHLNGRGGAAGLGVEEYLLLSTPRGVQIEFALRDILPSQRPSTGPIPPEGWTYEARPTRFSMLDGFIRPLVSFGGALPSEGDDAGGWRIMLAWLTMFTLAATPIPIALVWRSRIARRKLVHESPRQAPAHTAT